jgi:centromeric protein E
MMELPEDGDPPGIEEAVRVFVRIRPLNKREQAEKQTIGWNLNETSMLEDTPNGQRVYAYDHCFGPDCNNQETYDIVGKPVVLKVMEGFNGTVFTCR